MTFPLGLEETRRLLDRTIQALSTAEAALVSGASSTTAVLQEVERATRFIGEALWQRWEDERLERERAGAPAPPRASESHRALFRDWSTILGSDPSSPEARALVARWRTLVEAAIGSDEDITRDMLDAFSRWRQWPEGMKRYVASLYEMDVDTWQRVTDFIERAVSHAS